MTLFDFSLDDGITIFLIIAQAGILYYRLKKVEEQTAIINDLIVEFAVHKTSLKHHRNEFEKQSIRIDKIIQRLDDRILNIESHAYQALVSMGHAAPKPA